MYTGYIIMYDIIILYEVLITSYGTPLGQTASYWALQSSLFGPDGAVNYDCIVISRFTHMKLFVN